MNEPFNELTDADAEALALLVEEAAEVIKAVTKILRHGLHSTNPDMVGRNRVPTNQDDLNRELGDMQTAVNICIGMGILDREVIHQAARAKMRNVGHYLHHAHTFA